MTKQEEIEAFKRFTNSLPAQSYLRPWLLDITVQVEAEIRSDMPVSPSLSGTRKLCEEMVREAQSAATAMVDRAREIAEAKMKEAHDMTEGRIESAASALRRALHDLNRN